MDIEVTFTAVNGNQSVCIRAREQMETCNKEKIQTMKEAVNAFVPSGQQRQIEVKCFHNASQSATAQSVPPTGKKSDQSKKISSNQVGFLRKLLSEHKINVQNFCQENGISQIEELSMANARKIISDLNNL